MKYTLSAQVAEISAQLPADAGLIVFDSFCVLCSSTVSILMKIDRKGRLFYTSFDTPTGKDLSKALPPELESLVFLKNGQVYLQSDAVVKIIHTLGYPWKALVIIKFIPPGIRDAIYKFIARTRYRIFGRKEQCQLPSPEIRKRFIK